MSAIEEVVNFLVSLRSVDLLCTFLENTSITKLTAIIQQLRPIENKNYQQQLVFSYAMHFRYLKN